MSHSTQPLLWRIGDPGPTVDWLEAGARLRAVDPVLGRLIDRVGPLGLTPPDRASPFHYLQRAIVYQQLSGKAAATIFGRFQQIYRGNRNPSPPALLDTPITRLRAAGLSNAKALALLDLARHAQAGRLPSRRGLGRLAPEAAVENLCQVRGVGRWTAEMLLMFYLGHPDVLPVGDLGIRKGFARTYGMKRLPAARTLLRRGESWRPFRTIACWYLWRALELPPD
jgi:3-methyladenine DNA glycosylase/8-oxoguanine DNA glycosylase